MERKGRLMVMAIRRISETELEDFLKCACPEFAKDGSMVILETDKFQDEAGAYFQVKYASVTKKGVDYNHISTMACATMEHTFIVGMNCVPSLSVECQELVNQKWREYLEIL